MSTRSAEAEVKLIFSSTIKNTLDDGQVASVTVGDTLISGKLRDGVEVNQISRAWCDTDRSLASGNTEDIDIYDFAGEDIGAGDGRDGLGLLIEMDEVVTFCVRHVSGAGRLELMPTNPTAYCTWVPSLTVTNGGALKAGGLFLMHQPAADGFDVQDGVSHVIRIGASGGDIVYNLYIVGRHDDAASSSSTSSLSTSSRVSTSSTSSSPRSTSSQSSSCSTTT